MGLLFSFHVYIMLQLVLRDTAKHSYMYGSPLGTVHIGSTPNTTEIGHVCTFIQISPRIAGTATAYISILYFPGARMPSAAPRLVGVSPVAVGNIGVVRISV